jgi:TRAP-type C4-dicarboxylate transport system permease small subunit
MKGGQSMEKRCCLFRVVGFIVFLGLLSATPIIAAEANWKFFTYLPTNDPGVSLFRDFAADVLKSSNGRFEIKVFSAGELPYKPVDEIKITASNQVQLADVPVGFVAGDVPELNVFSLPFLCTTFDGFFKSIGIVAPIIEEDLMKRFKLSVLFHWTMPPQNLWTLEPVKKLEDIKGKKIRAWNPEQVKMLQLLGGSPVSIASDEVATSLQRRWVGSICLFLMILLINLEVVGRYFLNFSTLIVDEYGAYLFVACTFLGMAYSFRQGHFLRVTMATNRLTPTVARYFYFGACVVGFIFSSIITCEVVKLTYTSYLYNSKSIQPSSTPLVIPQLILPIGMVLITLSFLIEAVRVWVEKSISCLSESGKELG